MCVLDILVLASSMMNTRARAACTVQGMNKFDSRFIRAAREILKIVRDQPGPLLRPWARGASCNGHPAGPPLRASCAQRGHMLSATPRGAAHSSTSSCSSAAVLLLVVHVISCSGPCWASFSGPYTVGIDGQNLNWHTGGLPRVYDALEASGSWRPTCTQRDWAERPSVCEPDFRQRVSGALSTVGTILQGTRTPTLAEVGTNHTYSDKYELSEFLTNTAIAAQLNVLERMGLDSATLIQLREMSAARSVSLRFKSKEECRFAKKVETEHVGHRQLVEEVQTVAPDDDGDVVVIEEKTTKRKVITNSTAYQWTYSVEYQLVAFAGNEPEAPVAVLQSQQGEETLVTSTKASPLPDVTVHEPVDVTITWLLQQLAATGVCDFKIDRLAKACYTPRRNAQTEAAATFFAAFDSWVERCFALLPSNAKLGRPPVKLPAGGLFVPVLPLLQDAPSEAHAAKPTSAGPNSQEEDTLSRSLILSMGEINLLLEQQGKSLDASHAMLAEMFHAKDTVSAGVVSVASEWLRLLMVHSVEIRSMWLQGVSYIEHMLRQQLNNAIGKTLQPKDFDEFMRHHEAKLFKSQFAPKPFSYAIRRPDHYPDGTLSIESKDASEPVMTVTRKLSTPDQGKGSRMSFALNAATSVEFHGDTYLHAWVAHRFAGEHTVPSGVATPHKHYNETSLSLLIIALLLAHTHATRNSQQQSHWSAH